VIKKYRKEDKNFEAPERTRAGAFKSIKWYKEQSGLSRQRYGLIPKWHFDIFQGRWKLKSPSSRLRASDAVWRSIWTQHEISIRC
jgi:hypothetical protein